MISAVLIDIDDTILDYTASAAQAIEGLFSQSSLPFEGQKTIDAYFTESAALWDRVNRSLMSSSELREIRWNRVFKALNIDRCDGASFEARFREQLSKTTNPIEGAEEILSYLSKKYRLCAASNAYLFQQNARLVKAGFRNYFEKVFTSNEIGFEKPDRRFFEFCTSSLGIKNPNEVIMIGDSVHADIIGAKKAGLKTLQILLQNEKSNCADYAVSSLSQIKDIL